MFFNIFGRLCPSVSYYSFSINHNMCGCSHNTKGINYLFVLIKDVREIYSMGVDILPDTLNSLVYTDIDTYKFNPIANLFMEFLPHGKLCFTHRSPCRPED